MKLQLTDRVTNKTNPQSFDELIKRDRRKSKLVSAGKFSNIVSFLVKRYTTSCSSSPPPGKCGVITCLQDKIYVIYCDFLLKKYSRS